MVAVLRQVQLQQQQPPVLQVQPQQQQHPWLKQLLTPHAGVSDNASLFSHEQLAAMLSSSDDESTRNQLQNLLFLSAAGGGGGAAAATVAAVAAAAAATAATTTSSSSAVSMGVDQDGDYMTNNNNNNNSNNQHVFPWKLYKMLQEAPTHNFAHIVSWVQGGEAFKVHSTKDFVSQVMPQYFDQTKYESFRRQ
jgi:hypothetical protein